MALASDHNPSHSSCSVPQHPQALRFAVSYVAPRVDPATGGEKRLAAAEYRTA